MQCTPMSRSTTSTRRPALTIEVFYADRALETFGRCGAGWFWWSRRRGFSPDGTPTGPFATSYAAYRHAMNCRQLEPVVTTFAALLGTLWNVYAKTQ